MSLYPSFQKTLGVHDLNVLEFFQGEEVAVTADDEVGPALDCAFEDAVVLGVLADGVDSRLRADEFRE